MGLRKLHKLKEEHLHLTPSLRMVVKIAAQACFWIVAICMISLRHHLQILLLTWANLCKSITSIPPEIIRNHRFSDNCRGKRKLTNLLNIGSKIWRWFFKSLLSWDVLFQSHFYIIQLSIQRLPLLWKDLRKDFRCCSIMDWGNTSNNIDSVTFLYFTMHHSTHIKKGRVPGIFLKTFTKLFSYQIISLCTVENLILNLCGNSAESTVMLSPYKDKAPSQMF